MPNQSRNRLSSGKMNFGGGNLMNQVNPWLSQSNNNNSFIGSPQAQLALASNLLNNLLSPSSQLNKLSQPPSLLSLGNLSDSSFGGSSSFVRDRFSSNRPSLGRISKRDDFRKPDKNKRFGNDRKSQSNKKPIQLNKKSNDEKNLEKKDADKKEDIKIENCESVRDEEKPVKEEVRENESSTADFKKGEEAKVRYSEIPPALLYCHICRKHMWDDASFEKHLEGRPHKIMIEELNESYKLKVDLLRHEMRVMEQQRENDITRAQRKNKNNAKSQTRGFCTMCNLSFLGMLPAHRKNERHQRLKKFLHPKCNVCSKEFYTRLEWDDHKLTAAHLKKLAEIRKETRPDLENTEFDITDFIEDINDEVETEVIDIKVSGKRENMDDLKEEDKGETGEETDDMNGEQDENEKAEEDEEGKKLPKYNPGIPVGENFVVEKTGYYCRICNRFILTLEDSKIHCQTVIHYNNTIKVLKAQDKIVKKRRINETKTEDDDDIKLNEDNINESDESDAKKRKIENYENNVKKIKMDDENSDKIEEKIKTENLKKGTGEDKYDPEEVDSEPEKDSVTNTSSSDLNPKIIIDDCKKEKEDNASVKEEEKESLKKPVTRGPRARRGRKIH